MHDKDFYLDLNIDVRDALSSSLSLSEFRKTGANADGPVDVWHLPKEKMQTIFNIEWLDFIQKEINVDLAYALIFYRTSNYFHRDLHVDSLPDPLRIINYGINFVEDKDDDSEMIWYELNPKDGTLEDNFMLSGGLPTCTWSLDDFNGKELARKTIGRNLVLVKTSLPHTVQTFTKPRWSFSLRFTDLDLLSWEEAVAKFSKFV